MQNSEYNWRWAVTSVLLAFMFFLLALYYASNDSLLPSIVWFALCCAWLYSAARSMLKGDE